MRSKTQSELQAMRDCSKILATIFRDLRQQVVAGVSEKELDAWVAREIQGYGAEATYRTAEVNFPGTICISTNDQVVHSIPTDYILRDGDIVGFDLVIGYNGMKTDSAFTVIVGGTADAAKQRLVSATERSLYAGIEAIAGPTKTGDIAAAIETVLTANKLGIVRELVGHGIGHSMHEAPDVPNYGRAGRGVLLQPGDTVAIEPMATLGSERIVVTDDKWTICTADSSLAAHFEHTVLITEDSYEILTKL